MIESAGQEADIGGSQEDFSLSACDMPKKWFLTRAFFRGPEQIASHPALQIAISAASAVKTIGSNGLFVRLRRARGLHGPPRVAEPGPPRAGNRLASMTDAAPTLDLDICALLREERRLKGWQIDQARGDAIRWGTSIGENLLAAGAVSARDWAAAAARIAGLDHADLLASPPAPGLLRPEHRRDYLRLGLIPWRRAADGALVLAVTRPDQGAACRAWAAEALPGEAPRLAVTAKFDILWSVQRAFDAEAAEAAPARPRGRRFLALGAAAIGAMLAWPALAAPMLAAAIALPLLPLPALAWAGAHRRAHLAAPPAAIAALREAELPPVTLVIPAAGAEGALPGLLERLRGLDYPRARLDVKLVFPAEDGAGIAAAKALRAEAIVEILVLPAGEAPFGPARAGNYALRFARGELVGLLDPRAAPPADWLRRAAHAFRAGGEGLGMVQARLALEGEGWIGGLAAQEAALWHGLLLPGLGRLAGPLPFEGAPCLARSEAVIEVGGWDEGGAAPDLALALGLARRGLRLRALPCLFNAPAPARLGPWLAARRRRLGGLARLVFSGAVHPAAGLGRPGAWMVAALALGRPLAGLALPGLAALMASRGAAEALPALALLLAAALPAEAMLLARLAGSGAGRVRWVALAPLLPLLDALAAWHGLGRRLIGRAGG